MLHRRNRILQGKPMGMVEQKRPKKYSIAPCQCTYSKCRDWHVHPVAAVQNVKFTQEQAQAVADLLNSRSWKDERC